MNRSGKTVTAVLWSACALILAGGVFWLGYGAGRRTDSKLQEAFDSNQSDAAVVKRVSQQMEEIAYQQKAISDRQRDRAEQQSQLAMEMRDRAEQESRAARQAENDAIQWATRAEASAEEAKEQREMALLHQKEAEVQRDEATRAKSVTDTLSFRTLGRTLGYSSSVQLSGGRDELANMLAYAGWYYMKEYRGNTYQSDLFNALSNCTGSRTLTSIGQRGGVNAIVNIDGGGYVAASDFGEVELYGHPKYGDRVLLQNSDCNFKDIYADKDNVYALSLHGPLCVVGYDRQARTVEVPAESYLGLFNFMNGKVLMLIGRNSYCSYSLASGTTSEPVAFPGTVSAYLYRDTYTMIFFEDGSYCEMGNSGVLTSKPSPSGKVVTSAEYDPLSGCTFLGCADGDIEVMLPDGSKSVITGHSGRIIDILPMGRLLISSSYDRSLSVWNLAASAKSGMMDTQIYEQLQPAEVYFDDGWPLSICRITDDEILCGGSNGQILRMNVSTDKMAEKALERCGREFTAEEWNTFIGATVPYKHLFTDSL